jgi:DNA-binding MarR family transcriptional regulator
MGQSNKRSSETMAVEAVDMPAVKRQGNQDRLRLWLRLFSAVGMIERELRERLHREYGVSLAKFDYLSQLYRQPQEAMRMGTLSEQLMVTGGSITGMTDRLERDGLVRREADAADRRVQLIELTDEGRALFARMARDHENWVSELLGGLSGEEVRAQLAGLTGVKDSVYRALSGSLTKTEN